ncbi:MAG: hypothetical protein KAI47_24775, partial [Deltaproteobacteria bacterium]|nr:hypothetical protein [Deltaproteobacteria bacterium]
ATCPALLPVLNEALEVLRHGLLAYDRGAEGSAVLLADESAAVCHLSVLVDRGPALGPEGFLKHPIMGAVVFDRSGAVERAGAEGVSLGEAGIRGSADAFAQAQIEQDAWLRGRVSAWSDATAPQRIVELFAGGGNLTRVLAAPGREVVAVELSPSSLVWLERNVVGLPGRIEVRAGRAEVELEAISGAVDLVVLDPPREGARDVMSHIARLRPKAVIYVSCDPMTLARDLTILGEAGYRIESLWGLDMMPQTYHVEAAVWLTLSGT